MAARDTLDAEIVAVAKVAYSRVVIEAASAPLSCCFVLRIALADHGRQPRSRSNQSRLTFVRALAALFGGKVQSMDEQDPQRVYEQLKKEHMRALTAGDLEALQRVQEKLEKVTRRDCARNQGGRVGPA